MSQASKTHLALPKLPWLNEATSPAALTNLMLGLEYCIWLRWEGESLAGPFWVQNSWLFLDDLVNPFHFSHFSGFFLDGKVHTFSFYLYFWTFSELWNHFALFKHLQFFHHLSSSHGVKIYEIIWKATTHTYIEIIHLIFALISQIFDL